MSFDISLLLVPRTCGWSLVGQEAMPNAERVGGWLEMYQRSEVRHLFGEGRRAKLIPSKYIQYLAAAQADILFSIKVVSFFALCIRRRIWLPHPTTAVRSIFMYKHGPETSIPASQQLSG